MIPATLMLWLWPVIGLAFIAVLGPVRGTAISVLVGLMILPETAGLDLPLVDPGKSQIVSVTALVGLIAFSLPRVGRARVGRGADLLLLVWLGFGVLTSLTNREPAVQPAFTKPGLVPLDVVSTAVTDLLTFAVPFLVGRLASRSPSELRTWLRILVGATCVYGLLALFEVRFSPQLHRWVYGQFPHSFAQHVRSGGFRPMVFMSGGLPLSMFFMAGALAATTLERGKQRFSGVPSLLPAGYLLSVLLLCKSLASICYGLLGNIALRVLSPRAVVRIALLIAALALAYPFVRIAGAFPTQPVLDAASWVDPDRADSLAYRFSMEDRSLDWARQSYWLGWSYYYNRNRPGLLDDYVILDSLWINQFSARGAIGMTLTVVMFSLPIVRAWRSLHRLRDPADRWCIAGMSLICALQLFDTLPNGLFSMWPLLSAGLLWGSLANLDQPAVVAKPAPSGPPTSVPPKQVAGLRGLLGRGRGGRSAPIATRRPRS